MEKRWIDIAGHRIGPGEPCFIVAEAGVNHNGSLALAKEMIDIAANAGANAVKFQTFLCDEVISPQAPKANYQKEGNLDSESQLDMIRKLELSFRDFRELASYAKSVGIPFLSTPFDKKSADLLIELGVGALKVASGELVNPPFLSYLAKLGKPMIISTGMATLGEVENAIQIVYDCGNQDIVLLHCVSNYPANPKNINLRAINTMSTAFRLPVGFSDHTTSYEIPIAAVALGACLIEKHFTTNRHLPGPDHQSSIEPGEFASLVKSIRVLESSLGNGIKKPSLEEMETAAVARRSLVAARDIKSGTVLTEELVAFKRPGYGLPYHLLQFIVGRIAITDMNEGDLFTLEKMR